jgi:hypothetical protein
MADRQVTRTGKDADRDITKLCNPGQVWSPRSKAGAISDIDGGTHTYFVQSAGKARTNVQVINGASGKYLRTTADSSSKNNLDNLPDC